jgi:ABC-type transport system involved in multi-copper enzyme maturation permease subunit
VSNNPSGLTGLQATLALARLAVVRTVRGKALWIAMALSLLPLVVVGVQVGLGHTRETMWQTAFMLTLLTLPIIPPILIGPSMSDEIEDKTSAYLWSRALPRWSIIAGKLVGLAPVAAAISVVALAIAWFVIGGPGAVDPATAARGFAGAGFATLIASTLVAAIATLVPRHAVAVSVVYLLFVDKIVGELPIKLKFTSIAFGGRAIAGFTEGEANSGALAGVATLVVIAALSLFVATTRISRME